MSVFRLLLALAALAANTQMVAASTNWIGLIAPERSAVAQSFIPGLSVQGQPPTDAEARSGCCSHHGGVAGCDTATGHAACNDGSDSPSCGCD
jgi:hypothetical protein